MHLPENGPTTNSRIKPDGQLEPTNEPYAISKIAGIKQCESYNRQYGRNYRCIMPTNLYGPNDNFHPTESHVLPGLMKEVSRVVMRQDEEVVVWGSEIQEGNFYMSMTWPLLVFF